ncbi:MAG: hypothetical protein EPO25_10250 [Gammaproteobacteria bacterium]|nr:MAG: hypothetical protein EPO25_10250 [Gammaproteobacteria bacterium]
MPEAMLTKCRPISSLLAVACARTRLALTSAAIHLALTFACHGALASVADDIRIEATRPNQDAEGYALPLISHWTTGNHALSRGWAPARQLELIDQGHYLLPWFQLPGRTTSDYPQTAAEFTEYYEESIKRAAVLRLPLVFIASQWEAGLSKDPYLRLPAELNPNVVTADGIVLPKVSPFGPVQPWIEIGLATTATSWMKQIAEWYPDPPLVIFLSNNEHAKLMWKDAELDRRYVAANGTGTSKSLKKDLVSKGWIERYRALQAGMRSGLASPAWRSASIFIGYDAAGPPHFGRWAEWDSYALNTSEFIDPSPLVWDGGSPSFYTDNWRESTDFTMYCPQIEFMNLVFMNASARLVNPRFWYEMSVWDGHMPDDPATDKRGYYESLGQSYSPARYGGMVRFGMWLTRPRAVREFRDWVYPREDGNDYFMSLVAAVDEVHNTPLLRDWWQRGTLVVNPAGMHPYQVQIPPEYQSVNRWFLLDSDANPPKPWAPSTRLRVYALAMSRVRDHGAEWLVYAHAPTGPVADADVKLPGYGVLRIMVPTEGAFYQVGRGEVRRVMPWSTELQPRAPLGVRAD